MKRSDTELEPRNGYILRVIVVARISGGHRQKEASLEDQADHAKSVVEDLYSGTSEYQVLSTKAKGERNDRPELKELERLIRSRQFDLLIAEDLGRIIRGAEATRICGLAVDHGVRVISPNDCIDTADDSWEEDVISACRDHVGHNAHTSKRLKKKLMNRFVKNGGSPARPIWGYSIPEDAKTYGEWRKDMTATPIYLAWFEQLNKHGNCSAVADWLNEKGIPTGPYADNPKWDGRMVRRVTANPLLTGMPARGHKHTVKQHEFGRRIAVKNPDGPTYYECPELAHVPPELFDAVNAKLTEQNRGLGRKLIDGRDTRARVLKKRTRWPGQHILCGICGRLMYWGGHGQKEHMMCAGAREYACWNTATFDGVAAGPKLLQAFVTFLDSLTGYDEVLFAAVEQTFIQATSQRNVRLLAAEQAVAKHQREVKHVTDAIAEIGPNLSLKQKLIETDNALKQTTMTLRQIQQEPQSIPDLPPIEVLKAAGRKVADLGFDSLEFSTAMKAMIPKLLVFPFRSRDGGHIVQRAVMDIYLASLAGDAEFALEGQLRTTVVVDLFEPPQRIRFMSSILNLKPEGGTEREIANQLEITQPVVQRAMALHRMMETSNSQDPYVPLLVPPREDSKMRKHQQKRYEFRPLEGFPHNPPPSR